jgi:hypothetical protein
MQPEVIPMTGGLSDAESALDLSQSKAEHVRHSHSYGFRVLTQRCDKGGVLCVLKSRSSWGCLPHPYPTTVSLNVAESHYFICMDSVKK